MYNYTPVEINKVHNGEQRVYKFDNGYGASVIRHQYSYGGDKGLWELAVLKNGELCYDTEVTSDVEGHLNDDDVDILLSNIKEL